MRVYAGSAVQLGGDGGAEAACMTHPTLCILARYAKQYSGPGPEPSRSPAALLFRCKRDPLPLSSGAEPTSAHNSAASCIATCSNSKAPRLPALKNVRHAVCQLNLHSPLPILSCNSCRSQASTQLHMLPVPAALRGICLLLTLRAVPTRLLATITLTKEEVSSTRTPWSSVVLLQLAR